MEESARFKLLIVVAGLVLFGGWALFMETARRYARQAVAWHELPPPVRATVLDRFGKVVVIEIERGPTADRHPTYRIRATAPDTRAVRLWLAADGTSWPPATPDPAAASDHSPTPRD